MPFPYKLHPIHSAGFGNNGIYFFLAVTQWIPRQSFPLPDLITAPQFVHFLTLAI
jgi:hypothetical protein